jgi:AcrR family transcriptional regulator
MEPSALLRGMPVAPAECSGLRYLFMPQPSVRTRRLTQEERTDLSGRRMIECAVELVVERGVTGTKLTDVGLRAGYSRGLAAMRFGTKAGLLGHVARHVTSNWITHLRLAVGPKTGLAAVLAAIDAQEEAIVETPAEMRALYAIFFQSSDPSAEYRVDVARTLTAQRRDLANWLREARDAAEIPSDVDPARIAGQVLSSMIGIVYQWIMDPAASVSELHRDLKALLGDYWR